MIKNDDESLSHQCGKGLTEQLPWCRKFGESSLEEVLRQISITEISSSEKRDSLVDYCNFCVLFGILSGQSGNALQNRENVWCMMSTSKGTRAKKNNEGGSQHECNSRWYPEGNNQ